MKVLAFDPGKTTGWCLVLLDSRGKVSVVISGQEPLDENLSNTLESIGVRFRPDVVVMESVVTTGQLNADKVAQIRAADRIINAFTPCGSPATWRVGVTEVQPEIRRLVKEVPAEVKGTHARDAYRQAVGYAMKECLADVTTTDIKDRLE